MKNRSILFAVLQEYFFYILILILAVVILSNFFLFSYYKSTETFSMFPTIPPETRMILFKKAYYFNKPERGDIINFQVNKDVYTKRIIALSGDKLTLSEDSIFINGKELPTEKVGELSYTDRTGLKRILNHYIEKTTGKESRTYSVVYIKDGDFVNPFICRYCSGSYVVPEDSFFVMGDNRDVSEDSRVLGFINKNRILGKVVYVFR